MDKETLKRLFDAYDQTYGYGNCKNPRWLLAPDNITFDPDIMDIATDMLLYAEYVHGYTRSLLNDDYIHPNLVIPLDGTLGNRLETLESVFTLAERLI